VLFSSLAVLCVLGLIAILVGQAAKVDASPEVVRMRECCATCLEARWLRGLRVQVDEA
jgi:hypothetical protein